MKPADDLILEYLRDATAATPQDIANNIDRNNKYVGVRCRKMTNARLLERPAHGLYRLTDEGESFLDGDLDAGGLPDPSED